MFKAFLNDYIILFLSGAENHALQGGSFLRSSQSLSSVLKKS